MRRWLATVIVSLGLVGSAGAQSPELDSRRDLPGAFVVNRPAYLYAAPSADAQIVTKLRPKTVIDVVEVREQWYKVQSATGKAPGWLRRSYADPAGGPRREARRAFRKGIYELVSPSYVYASPDVGSNKTATLREGQQVLVVDEVGGNWYRIESESGNRPPGFIPMVAAKRVRDAD